MIPYGAYTVGQNLFTGGLLFGTGVIIAVVLMIVIFKVLKRLNNKHNERPATSFPQCIVVEKKQALSEIKVYKNNNLI